MADTTNTTSTNKAVSIDMMKTSLERAKQEARSYTDQKVAESTTGGVEYATEEEISAMLDEVFGADSSNDAGTGTDGSENTEP